MGKPEAILVMEDRTLLDDVNTGIANLDVAASLERYYNGLLRRLMTVTELHAETTPFLSLPFVVVDADSNMLEGPEVDEIMDTIDMVVTRWWNESDQWLVEGAA